MVANKMSFHVSYSFHFIQMSFKVFYVNINHVVKL